MNSVYYIFSNIADAYKNSSLNTSIILGVLLVSVLLSAFEFMIYRLVSHRAFYNRTFNISIAVLPIFISTIILCLQSNIVITLGTIGALAIIRFRTAIKDPVDMIYLLWSIHIGITCGCRLFEVAVLTSIVVTIVMLILENVSFGRKPFLLVVNLPEGKAAQLTEFLNSNSKKYNIKSRNYTGETINMVIELRIDEPDIFAQKIKELEIEKFSLIKYESDDIV